MKKMLLLLPLFLLPLWGLGEDFLYPARVNDKWGYINGTGEMVIAPQWESAEYFSGNTAMVQGEKGYGVIDRRGELLLEPVHDIAPYPYIYRIWGEDEAGDLKSAYFEPASGYFSPFIYDYIVDYNRDDPAAPIAVWMDDPPLLTYIIPATGEKAFENEYNALYDDAAFCEGYALASNEWIKYDEEGYIVAAGPEFHLIDYTGKETIFPAGISPDSRVQENYLRISRFLTEAEREAHPSGWGTVYGLARPDGEIVIAPQYDYLYPPEGGCAVFMMDHLLGHIDLETGTVVEPRFDISTGGELPYYRFRNGYALLDWVCLADGTWGQLLIDRQGKEIISGGNSQEIRLTSEVFTPGGLCVYEKDGRYGLMKITEGQAAFITDAIYEDITTWDYLENIPYLLENGWLPVKMDGLWGYINEQAEMVIPPQWEEADLFRAGLAQVTKDGKMAYINLQGNIIWQEP